MTPTEKPRINGVRPPSWLDLLFGCLFLLIGFVMPLFRGAQFLEIVEVWAMGTIVTVLCLIPVKWWMVLLALPAGYWPASQILGVGTPWGLVWLMAFLTAVFIGGDLYYLRIDRKNQRETR